MSDYVVGKAQVMAGLVRCGMRVHGAWGNGGAPQTRATQFQDGQRAQTKPCMAASRSASALCPLVKEKITLVSNHSRRLLRQQRGATTIGYSLSLLH